MSGVNQTDSLLIEKIRAGDQTAWTELISRYEGRLLAFVESRLNNRAAAEDVVQEAFIGLLNSLPNYDGRRALESYLFAICAYKMTDHMRREGRRPAVPLSVAENSSGGAWQMQGADRVASSIARSGERRGIELEALSVAIADQIEHWQQKGEWNKIKCIELLLVRGSSNKDVAAELDLSEQQVANFKFDFLARLKKHLRKQGLNEDIFPELYDAKA